MKKGRILGKIFGIAVVFVMVASMAGQAGLAAPSLDDDPLHQLPATSGKISYFASDDGHPGVCDPAAWGELLGEHCGTDDASKYWYCAMRWPYVNGSTEAEREAAKAWWHNKKILVTNPENSKQVVLAAKDWGPNETTGRVIDVSEAALNALGAVTDAVVSIEFADQSTPLGPVISGSLCAGTSNPGVVYRYVGGKNWEPISPTSELHPEDIVSESINVESPHPYPNNYNNTWTEVRLGAAAIRVHFSYIQTESYYDHVYIRDSDGNIINDCSGYYADVWTSWVFGNTIKIQLTSDYSVVEEGFVIDGLEWSTTQPQMPLGYAVLCLVDYDGQLYAGTVSTSGYSSGAGSSFKDKTSGESKQAMSTSDSSSGVGRVYRYDGGTGWTLVGNNLDNQVSSLAVYQGNLYAGTAWNGMRLYKYTPGTTNCGIANWTRKVDYTSWDGARALYVSHGYLLMGDIHWDYIGHWDGSDFHPDQTETTGSCIYDFEDYGDYVYAAALGGRMWRSPRSPDAINWTVVLDYYDGNMWELETFQDLLYMSYDNGELRGTDDEADLRGMLKYTAPDGIISMTTGGDLLYFGTGGEAGAFYGSETEGIANIYKYDGTEVTLISHEDEFGAGVQVLYYTAPADQPPIASFTYSPESPFSGDIVSFDASSSYDPDGTIVTYEWYFGDGSEIEMDPDPSAQHRFRGAMNESKTYTVSLTVKDDEGAAASDTCEVIITPLKKPVEAIHQPTIPTPGVTVFAKMEVSYNWVDEINGEDIYIVSRADCSCDGFIGIYAFNFIDTHSRADPWATPTIHPLLWWGLLPSWDKEKTYGTDCFDAFEFFREKTYGEDFFEGIEVYASDIMYIAAYGYAGIHWEYAIPFLEWSSRDFQPESAEVPSIPLDINDLNLAHLCSPSELRVRDSQGRVTGLVNGEVREEIPYSFSFDNTVVVLAPTDSYRYEVVGTEEGTYGLGITSAEDGEPTAFAATDIPTTDNATHEYTIDWDALSEGEAGVTIKKDSDGDGEFEETIVTSQPNTPSNPSPSNDASGVPMEIDLSWTGGDPDEEDSVTYYVYFGTDENPPLVSDNQTELTYHPTLGYGTKYYWRVMARDEHGIATEGPVWDFTTTAEEVTVLTGLTGEVNYSILAGVTVELFKDDIQGSTTSDESGNYELTATETGDYTVTASKSEFRDETQTISVTDLGQEYTLNFLRDHALVPNAPDMSYALLCIHHWKYPSPECGISMSKALSVVHAWKYPV